MDDRSPTAPIGSYAWPDAQHPSTYLPVTNEATVALLETGPDNSEPLKTRDWMDALRLEGRWRNLAIHPEKATAGWLALVRNSFEAQVLTPATAWICLENGAQLNTLMKKQKDVLNANVNFDASEVEPTPMSEPELWWLLVPMLLFLMENELIHQANFPNGVLLQVAVRSGWITSVVRPLHLHAPAGQVLIDEQVPSQDRSPRRASTSPPPTNPLHQVIGARQLIRSQKAQPAYAPPHLWMKACVAHGPRPVIIPWKCLERRSD